MRRALFLGFVLLLAACSLLVDTDGLSGPAAVSPEGGALDDGSVATADGSTGDAAVDPCKGGPCAPPIPPCDGPCLPVLLATDNQPKAIVADETGAYWTATGGGDIRRSSVDGSRVDTLFDGQNAPTLIAVDETHVYWTEYSKGFVRAIPKDSTTGVLSAEVANQNNPAAITTAPGVVLWQIQGTGAIIRASKSLATYSAFAMNGKAVAFAADSTYLYAAIIDGIDRVRRIAYASAGMLTDLTPVVSDIRAVAVSGSRVYYTSGGSVPVVASTALDGSDPRAYGQNEKEPRSVAVDATHVYWGNYGDGFVRRAPIAGGLAETVATTPASVARVVSIAVNSQAIYWIAENGSVFMLRKP